jgi:hypothetical protein
MLSTDGRIVAEHSEVAEPITDREIRAERSQRLWQILLVLVLLGSTIAASTIIAHWPH